MRLQTVAVALMVSYVCLASQLSTVDAWTDFHALNPHHVRTELPDDRVHLSHDVHHVFPESGTYFKAKYEAVHHKKWHFVQLHHHTDVVRHVDCGASDKELLVRYPSDLLRDEVAKQDYAHTVLTAHQKFHCSNTGIFRLVTGATYYTETDTLRIHTQQVSYQHVFEYLDFVQDTNHLEHSVTASSPEDADASQENNQMLPSPEEDARIQEQQQDAEEAEEMRRGMRKQGSKTKTKGKLWKVGDSAKKVTKTYSSTIKKVCSVAAKVCGAPDRTVKGIEAGTFDEDVKKELSELKYNGKVTQKFEQWAFTGKSKFAVSVGATVGFYFRVLVKKSVLKLMKSYFYGTFNGGIRGAFVARLKYNITRTKEVANIEVSTITFAIGYVPVIIIIGVPVTVGFDLTLDGRASFNFLTYVSGEIRQGIRYSPSRGFETINEEHWQHQRDFSPRRFRHQATIFGWVQAVLSAQVNFLGGYRAGVQIGGEAIVKKSGNCMLLLQINLQPAIISGAQIDMRIGPLKLYQNFFGPMSLVSWKIPLLNYCISDKIKEIIMNITNGTLPNVTWPVRTTTASPTTTVAPSSTTAALEARGFSLQDAGSNEDDHDDANNDDGTQPTNPNTIEKTKQATLGYNESGISWFGKSSCYRPNLGQTALHFSLQFFPADNATELVLTVAQNVTTDASTEEDEDGISNHPYQLTNIQQTYQVEEELTTGSNVTMLHFVEEDPDEQYQANSSNAVLGNVSKSFRLTIGAEDITDITVHSESMFCGSVKLSTEQFSDDNRSFTIFASGESELAVKDNDLLDRLKAYVIYVPVLVAFVVLVVVAALCVRRRNLLAVHGAGWAKGGQFPLEEDVGTSVNSNGPEFVAGKQRIDPRVAAL